MSALYITTQGAYLRAKAGRYVVTRDQEEVISVPQTAVDCVILFGNIQLSTQAADSLLESGVSVLYLSQGGRFRGILQPGYSRNIFVRLAQYDAASDPVFSLQAAREVVDAKLSAQEVTLKKWFRNRWMEDLDSLDGVLAAKRSLASRESIDALRGAEANATQCYFQGLAAALPPPFEWNGRNRQPPRDPVNALLSLTYMLAVGEAVNACYVCGLDPFIGLLHQLDYGRPSLALDLIEPLRAACDHFVMRLLQAEFLAPGDFTCSEEVGCRLENAAFIRFLREYERDTDGTPSPRLNFRTQLNRLTRATANCLRDRKPMVWSDRPGEEC